MGEISRLLQAGRLLVCALLVAALVAFCFLVIHVNATTVSLAMLLLVLIVATRWGLREAIFTSIVCVFGFNYFFLPPIGTLTIADPQNWVALSAFLVSAIIASNLSANAKKRAEEAAARRREIERLCRLSRALLMEESNDLVTIALNPIRDIFGLSHVAFYESDAGEVFPSDPTPVKAEDLIRVAKTEAWETTASSTVLPVRLGTRVIGSVALVGVALTRPEQENIANLLAITFERTRAQQRAANAEAARQGERLKRYVLDGIAHDLKTPLTAIKTCISTLLTIPPKTEDRRLELLSIVDEETERLNNKINEAIQLARLESRKVTLQRTDLGLKAAFEGLVGDLAEARQFVIDIPEELAVSADDELLKQAFRHLLENACKYSSVNSPVEIRARSNGKAVSVSVSDRGPGISPRDLDRIFDKFYRGSRVRNSTGGTGMGLTIAKGIIEAHNGKIWAENRLEGGAVFTVELPTT